MKTIYVLDTSVFLTDYKAIYSYGKNNIYIPLIVLEEIDKHKKRSDGVGFNARNTIKILDELRKKGSLFNGIKIDKKKGLVFSIDFNPSYLPNSYDPKVPDNHIISSALELKEKNKDKKIILVSCDINLRVKCDGIGLTSQDYIPEHIIKKGDELYTGFTTLLVDDQFIDQFYKNEKVFITEADAKQQKVLLFANIFIILVSNANDKKTALCRWINDKTPLRKLKEYTDVWGIFAKNKEQSFALDLLLDPNVPVVSLVGKSGGGKTLLACAAGLSQIQTGKNSINTYTRLIISKPVQPVGGNDIGFLPGTKEEKMMPWLSPIQDNLRFLLGNDQLLLQQYIEKGIIEIEALTYIRGRSIQNAFIIIDETQNISRAEAKTLLTRVGEGSKIILTGDIEQIDHPLLDETTNGLTHIVEKLKYYDIFGHILMEKGERSLVASLCAKVL